MKIQAQLHTLTKTYQNHGLLNIEITDFHMDNIDITFCSKQLNH